MKDDYYSLNNIGEITNLLLKAANTAEALLAENEALKEVLQYFISCRDKAGWCLAVSEGRDKPSLITALVKAYEALGEQAPEYLTRQYDCNALNLDTLLQPLKEQL